MAQASSVQREPSMEEILASIRRIIEDNDTGRRPAIDFGQMHPEPEHEGNDRNVIEVEAFRAELQSTKPSASEPMLEVPVAKFDERRDVPDAAVRPSVAPGKVAPQDTSASVVEAPVVASKETSRTVTASWTPSSTRAVDQVEQLAGPAPEPERAPATLTAEPATVEERAVAKPAILSEQAGRQVSAAFGELSEAYAARSRKSFDEIAAEMMRPMLQEWLDNNLPTLVERLVREEIERVARGAQ